MDKCEDEKRKLGKQLSLTERALTLQKEENVELQNEHKTLKVKVSKFCKQLVRSSSFTVLYNSSYFLDISIAIILISILGSSLTNLPQTQLKSKVTMRCYDCKLSFTA